LFALSIPLLRLFRYFLENCQDFCLIKALQVAAEAALLAVYDGIHDGIGFDNWIEHLQRRLLMFANIEGRRSDISNNHV